MSRTPRDWQVALNLEELPDAEWMKCLTALEGRETIDGGDLEARGLTASALTPDEIEVALLLGCTGEEL